MSPKPPASLTRRSFFELTLVASTAFSRVVTLLGCIGKPPPLEYVETPDLPTLGGAPETDEGRTVAAFVDTVVPGKHRDPTGAVGGIDVDAPALFFDPEMPAKEFVGLLVLVLDSYADTAYQKRFANLLPTQRDRVLTRALAEIDQIEFAIELAKVAYFSSPAAQVHFGYPGANTGYLHDEDFSFRREMSKPHPKTERGNLP